MKRNEERGPWETTPGLLERYLELQADEKCISYSVMATMLSDEFNIALTKNSLIGKGRRLGLKLRKSPNIKGRKPPHRRRFKVKPAPDAPLAPDLPPRNDGQPLTLYQLGSCDCRWPLGEVSDRPPYLFCGQATEIGFSYCPKHHGISHSTPRKTWAEA